MDRESFQRLARLRLNEARALLDHGYWNGAYYLCGYAVECGLKACLAKKTKRYAFPPETTIVRNSYYTHNLKNLVNAVGDPLKAETKDDAKWALAFGWSEGGNRRYSTDVTERLAQEFYKAAADRNDGVLKCIKKYW